MYEWLCWYYTKLMNIEMIPESMPSLEKGECRLRVFELNFSTVFHYKLSLLTQYDG